MTRTSPWAAVLAAVFAAGPSASAGQTDPAKFTTGTGWSRATSWRSDHRRARGGPPRSGLGEGTVSYSYLREIYVGDDRPQIEIRIAALLVEKGSSSRPGSA
jgi:hypothetical protein